MPFNAMNIDFPCVSDLTNLSHQLNTIPHDASNSQGSPDLRPSSGGSRSQIPSMPTHCREPWAREYEANKHAPNNPVRVHI